MKWYQKRPLGDELAILSDEMSMLRDVARVKYRKFFFGRLRALRLLKRHRRLWNLYFASIYKMYPELAGNEIIIMGSEGKDYVLTKTEKRQYDEQKEGGEI